MQVLIVAIVFGSLFAAFTVAMLSGTALTFAAMHLVARALRDHNAIRRLEAEGRMDILRRQAGVPLLIDPTNRAEVSAWNQAVSEVYA